MSLEFMRAPIVGCDPRHGVYAEGDLRALPAGYRPIFETAIEVLGHMVPRGVELTGKQFAELLRDAGIASSPARQPLLQAIGQVMGVSRFSGAGADGATSSSRAAAAIDTAASSLGAVIETCTWQDLDRDPSIATRSGWTLRTTHPFDLGPGSAILVRMDGGEGLLLRMCDLLDHSPVGAESFSDAEEADAQAQFELMALLSNARAYSSLVTGMDGMTGQRRPTLPKADDGTPMTSDSARQSLRSMLESLKETDWSPQAKPMFLARLAPVINATAALRPYESLMGDLVVWRLPVAMVQQEFDALCESGPRGERGELTEDALEAAIDRPRA